MLINEENLKRSLLNFKGKAPFDHCIVDDFFRIDVAKDLETEFLPYDDPRWFCYKNALEDKKALNDWNIFPALTYKIFNELTSDHFVKSLSSALDLSLYPDPGLHGGGWHIHGTGGNLNPHYDYSIHPKISLQRKLNIIIYVSSKLSEEHGGHLGLWAKGDNEDSPGELIQEIAPKFNRAVIFDTTQNAWHGMCNPLVQPAGIYRKSLAVYYLTDPPRNCDQRQRALFAAREDQKNSNEVKELIKIRADSKNYSSAYRTEDPDSVMS